MLATATRRLLFVQTPQFVCTQQLIRRRNMNTISEAHAKIGGILGLAGAPTFTKGDNVIDLIKRDHRKAESTYKEFKATTDKKKKEELARALIKDLVQHAEVEQMLVYPLLKMRDTNADVIHDRSLHEHQEVRELLYAVDQTNFSDPSYESKLKAAMDANQKHVEEEEAETLPLLAKKYNTDELQRLGSAFETHKYTAPTHPHPSAPMQGPLAAAAGMAAKVGDLARDATHAAKNATTPKS